MMIAASLLLAAFSLADLSGSKEIQMGESLSVSSRRCDVDRQEGVVSFEGDVRVDYGTNCTLCAERVWAFLSGTNDLSRIVAAGRVAVTNGVRTGACDQAVFLRETGRLEMSGGGGRPLARLRDGSRNEVAGRTITFHLKSEQVEIVDAELLVDKAEGSVRDL